MVYEIKHKDDKFLTIYRSEKKYTSTGDLQEIKNKLDYLHAEAERLNWL